MRPVPRRRDATSAPDALDLGGRRSRVRVVPGVQPLRTRLHCTRGSAPTAAQRPVVPSGCRRRRSRRAWQPGAVRRAFAHLGAERFRESRAGHHDAVPARTQRSVRSYCGGDATSFGCTGGGARPVAPLPGALRRAQPGGSAVERERRGKKERVPGTSGTRRVRGSGGGIRTHDLWVMSPASCRCSTPRRCERSCSGPSAQPCAQRPRLPRGCPRSTLRRWCGARPGSEWFGVFPHRSRPRARLNRRSRRGVPA